MTNITRETPAQPLCVVRREVNAHLADVDRAVREIQLARAGRRSVDQRLADQMTDLSSRLQLANRTPLAEVPAIEFELSVLQPRRVPEGARHRRSRSPTAAPGIPLATSPRPPRLRLYSPTSPV